LIKHWREVFSIRLIALLFWVLMGAREGAWAGPQAVFVPGALKFQDVAVGDTTRIDLKVSNPGDSILVVSSVGFTLGMTPAFSISHEIFDVQPGDSLTLSVRFHPLTSGEQADALVFETHLAMDDLQPNRPVVSLSGRGIGPEIEVSPGNLVFVSSGIGIPTTQQVQVFNTGNDTLQISKIDLNDSRFSVNRDPFAVTPGSFRLIEVIYTPDSIRARSDTLRIETSDFDEGQIQVTLDALETPRRVGNGRLRLAQSDSIQFPQPGDTISVKDPVWLEDRKIR